MKPDLALPRGGSFVTRGELRFFVRELGEGPPVLMLSGLGFSSWCWDESMETLAPRFRTLTLDNRGSGRSDKPPGPYSIEQMADDAAHVLAARGVESAHVVGNSMGGYIALLLAMRHPGRVRSLVLVNTSHGGDGATTIPEETQSAWRAAGALPPRERAARSMSVCFPAAWLAENAPRFEAIVDRSLAHPTPGDAWLAQYVACARFFVPGIDARGIPEHALVMHGTDDRVIPYPNGTRLAAALPHARLHTFEGGGHVPYLERPAEYHGALEAFLVERESARG